MEAIIPVDGSIIAGVRLIDQMEKLMQSMTPAGTNAFLVITIGVTLTLFGISAGWTQYHDDEDDERKHCSATARALLRACESNAEEGYWMAVANCMNVSDGMLRPQCHAGARASRAKDEQLCEKQLTSRLADCRTLGEVRYDPAFDPAAFDEDFRNLTNPNRYFPLNIGNRREYRGGTETVMVEVLDETKLVAGVRCIVVRDIVTDGGRLIEATDDWFAHAKDGNVWYCGEEVKNFGSFKGDDPKRPELVNIDGSFKAGRNSDKPGIIFQGSPKRGEVYREEFSLGNAEDVAEVLSTTYAYGNDRELDRFVPQPLAALLCSGECVVTRNFTPIEPGVIERKYYAPGIGFFLQVNPATGQVVQLVSCNFDPRCGMLPAP